MFIIPAILPQDIEDLETKLFQVKGIAKWVQIDVCDGKLTSKPCWPYVNDDGVFQEILNQERGLPLWEFFDFEIDLMVFNPLKEYEKWIDAGASRIIFHYKEGKAEALKTCIEHTKQRGVDVGLALHIEHPVSTIEQFKHDVHCVQFMGIDRIGFQGEPFDVRVIEKIKEARSRYPDMHISVDGGVTTDSVGLLTEAGVDRLVIGSALFGEVDIKETYRYFESF